MAKVVTPSPLQIMTGPGADLRSAPGPSAPGPGSRGSLLSGSAGSDGRIDAGLLRAQTRAWAAGVVGEVVDASLERAAELRERREAQREAEARVEARREREAERRDRAASERERADAERLLRERERARVEAAAEQIAERIVRRAAVLPSPWAGLDRAA